MRSRPRLPLFQHQFDKTAYNAYLVRPVRPNSAYNVAVTPGLEFGEEVERGSTPGRRNAIGYVPVVRDDAVPRPAGSHRTLD